MRETFFFLSLYVHVKSCVYYRIIIARLLAFTIICAFGRLVRDSNSRIVKTGFVVTIKDISLASIVFSPHRYDSFRFRKLSGVSFARDVDVNLH